jgi:hypothetical protein
MITWNDLFQCPERPAQAAWGSEELVSWGYAENILQLENILKEQTAYHRKMQTS